MPDIAKRAHKERIDAVITEALKRAFKFSKSNFQFSKEKEIIEELIKPVDIIAVTYGPGLSIALGVGVDRAKELAKKYKKRLIAINHIEGHLMANWVKNRRGKPERKIDFPALSLTASGGHTKIILINQNNEFSKSNFQFSNGVSEEEREERKINPYFSYKVVGETLDDAAGEALDKAAKLLGLGYPGGPVIERLALEGDSNFLELPRPLSGQNTLDYSFSGLKTSFYYQIRESDKKKIGNHLIDLAASFQEEVFDTLLMKFGKAIEEYKPKSLMGSGGVMANRELRRRLRRLATEYGLPIYLPFKKELNTDNAAMIGVAAYFKALRGEFVANIEGLDKNPRAKLI